MSIKTVKANFTPKQDTYLTLTIEAQSDIVSNLEHSSDYALVTELRDRLFYEMLYDKKFLQDIGVNADFIDTIELNKMENHSLDGSVDLEDFGLVFKSDWRGEDGENSINGYKIMLTDRIEDLVDLPVKLPSNDKLKEYIIDVLSEDVNIEINNEVVHSSTIRNGSAKAEIHANPQYEGQINPHEEARGTGMLG